MVYQNIIEVHSRETQLRKPEMTLLKEVNPIASYKFNSWLELSHFRTTGPRKSDGNEIRQVWTSYLMKNFELRGIKTKRCSTFLVPGKATGLSATNF